MAKKARKLQSDMKDASVGTKARPSGIASLSSLPNDTLERIYHYLGFKDLLALAATCKTLRDVAGTPTVWADLLLRSYAFEELPQDLSFLRSRNASALRAQYHKLSLQRPAFLSDAPRTSEILEHSGSRFRKVLHIDGRRDLNFTTVFSAIPPGHYNVVWRLMLQPGYVRGYCNFRAVFGRPANSKAAAKAQAKALARIKAASSKVQLSGSAAGATSAPNVNGLWRGPGTPGPGADAGETSSDEVEGAGFGAPGPQSALPRRTRGGATVAAAPAHKWRLRPRMRWLPSCLSLPGGVAPHEPEDQQDLGGPLVATGAAAGAEAGAAQGAGVAAAVQAHGVATVAVEAAVAETEAEAGGTAAAHASQQQRHQQQQQHPEIEPVPQPQPRPQPLPPGRPGATGSSAAAATAVHSAQQRAAMPQQPPPAPRPQEHTRLQQQPQQQQHQVAQQLHPQQPHQQPHQQRHQAQHLQRAMGQLANVSAKRDAALAGGGGSRYVPRWLSPLWGSHASSWRQLDPAGPVGQAAWRTVHMGTLTVRRCADVHLHGVMVQLRPTNLEQQRLAMPPGETRWRGALVDFVELVPARQNGLLEGLVPAFLHSLSPVFPEGLEGDVVALPRV